MDLAVERRSGEERSMIGRLNVAVIAISLSDITSSSASVDSISLTMEVKFC